MHIVKATATDRDGNLVTIYVANTNNPHPFTTSQRDAARYETKDDASIVVTRMPSFRRVKLVPRS